MFIEKTLTLLGAQAGVNPITGLRSNPANESTVDGQIAIGSTANVRVDGFSVNDPGGIPLSDERTNADTIANNIVLPGALDGASLEGDSTTFIDNKIENAVFDGIQVAGSTSAPLGDTIQGNEIVGSQQDGIQLLSAHGVVIGGTSPARATASRGARARASTSSVAATSTPGSTNSSPTPSASDLLDSTFNSLHDNTVEFSRDEGISVTNDKTDLILANSVQQNDTSGVEVSGIVLYNVSGGEAVENNKVLNNGFNGIGVFGTSGIIAVDGTTTGAKVSGNDVENNGGDGIVLNGTTGSIFAANTLKNNAVGIHLVGSSSNEMIGNVADNNKAVGILLDANSTGNTVTENTALGNGVFDAEDLSTGTGTAGTANLWTRNSFKRDNRGGGLGQ